MTFYIHQVSQPTVERVEHEGREYLSFPMVPLREMVYEYPEEGTREYLPAAHIEESVHEWAGTPITAVHPPDRGNGPTVRTPDAYLNENIGEAHDPTTVEGGEKLRLDGFVDIEKANSVGGIASDVVELLEDGEELAVSPGYSTMGDEYVTGIHAGQEFDLVQGIPMPDHIAVFPPDQFNARCSPEDGCAAPRVNAVEEDFDSAAEIMQGSQHTPEVRESDKKRLGSVVLNALGMSSDDDEECSDGDCSCGQHTNSGNDDTDDDVDADDESVEETDETDNEDNEPMGDETETEETVDETETEETEEEVEETETESVEIDTEQLAEDLVEPVADAVEERMVTNYGLDDLKERKEQERQNHVDIVTNALDIDEDVAQDMGDEALAELAAKHGGRTEEETRTNYSAVPGTVDRQTEEPDDADDYPVAGRTAYEERKQNGDD